MKPKLEALLLDVDGTLADTEEIHRQAFNSAFAQAGLDWVWGQDLYHELLAVTGGRERIRFYLDRDRPEVSLPGDADAYIANLHRNKTEYFVGSLAGGITRRGSKSAAIGVHCICRFPARAVTTQPCVGSKTLLLQKSRHKPAVLRVSCIVH